MFVTMHDNRYGNPTYHAYCFVASIAHISLKLDGKLVVLVVATNRNNLINSAAPTIVLCQNEI
jgi:hypothetical protein